MEILLLESNELLTITLNMSLDELFGMLCNQLDRNIFEIKVEITWKMMQNEVSSTRYVDVPIYREGGDL
jgi:hypothetical protein